MHKTVIACALTLASLQPVYAEETDTDQGFSLMEEGAKLILRGLMDEIEPNVQELQELIEEFGPRMDEFVIALGPRLETLLELVDDFQYYGQPEMLPNGDIIIRRDPDAPAFVWPEPQGEIEL
jgi:hypothetical protein